MNRQRKVEERRLTGSHYWFKNQWKIVPRERKKQRAHAHTAIPHNLELILDQYTVSSASVACSKDFVAPNAGDRLCGITAVA